MSLSSIDANMRDLIRDVVREVVRDEFRDRRNTSAAPVSEEAYLSVTKAARLADVAPGTVRKWIRQGRLTGKYAGRVIRVSRLELERFLAKEATGPSGEEVKRRAAHLFGHAKTLRSKAA